MEPPKLMSILSRLPRPEQQKIAAWTACDAIPGLDPRDWRRDAYGFALYRADHGKQTEYGWEIDHIVALAAGGRDTLDNLRALHWKKNRQLGAEMGQTPHHLRGLMALGEIAKHNDQNPFRDALTGPPSSGGFGFGRRRP